MRRVDNVLFDCRVFPVIMAEYHRLRTAMVQCGAFWKILEREALRAGQLVSRLKIEGDRNDVREGEQVCGNRDDYESDRLSGLVHTPGVTSQVREELFTRHGRQTLIFYF